MCEIALLRESLRGPRRLRPATSRYRTRSFRGFNLCSFYIALRSHAREPDNPSSRDPAWPGRSRCATEERAFEHHGRETESHGGMVISLQQ